jgi:hypothetical protein
MDRKITPNGYTRAELLQFVAGAKSYLDGVNARLQQVEIRSTCWPMYMYEQVEYFNLNPPDELAQAIVNLQTDIGNVNLRLDALLLAMNSS